MMGLVPFDRYDRDMLRAFDGMDDLFKSFPFVESTPAFPMDVEDADDKYVVSAPLPGLKKDQIDVELNEGTLSVSVDKKESDEEKGKNYLHKETGEWSATRSVYLKDAATQGPHRTLRRWRAHRHGAEAVCKAERNEDCNRLAADVGCMR
jgi:HSP20 family protein